MPNPNLPGELGSIDYEKIIGGPLEASVRANAQAAQVAADFIKTVGFQDDGNGNQVPVTFTFQYTKEITNDSGNVTEETFELKVPAILLTNVPYFEVETVELNFHAKLNSVEKSETSSEFSVDSEVKGKHGWGVGHVKWKVNVSYQRSTKRSQKVERQYDQDVKVVAGSVEPPEGTRRIFNAMEEAITDSTTS